MDPAIIQRLDSLFDAVRSEDDTDRAYRHNDKFLSNHRIRLTPHNFSKPPPSDTNPTMFFARYSTFSDKHPIDMKAFDSPEDSELFLRYHSFDPKGTFMSPMSRTRYITDYLLEWTIGGQIPRKLPLGSMDLLPSRSISHVYLPHYLLSNKEYRWDLENRHGWNSMIFEYNKFLPHVIILSTHFKNVANGTILHGELELIITAMNARAKQPIVQEEGEDDEWNYLFAGEKRFPVLMVSMVAPSHGRILHACMNDGELLIRLSELYNLEKKNPSLFDFFSSWLLSYPQSEPILISPQMNLPMR